MSLRQKKLRGNQQQDKREILFKNHYCEGTAGLLKICLKLKQISDIWEIKVNKAMNI